MSINLDEFYQTFFDEADELLNDMEQHLLQIDPDHPDEEQLHAIFRAAHSIKGGAGTFGLTILQETTHLFENLLDQARHHERNLDAATIDIFLETKDMLSDQLNAYRQKTEPDQQAYERICAVLRALAEEHSGEAARATAEGQVPGSQDNAGSAGAAAGSAPEGLAITVTGVDSDTAASLLEELSLFGTLSDQQHEDSTLSVHLVTETGEEDIHAVLCFVVDSDQIHFGSANREAVGSVPRTIVVSGVDADTAAKLGEELALFGSLSHQQHAKDELQVSIETETGDDDLRAVLCFIVDDDQIRIEHGVSPPVTPSTAPEPVAEGSETSAVDGQTAQKHDANSTLASNRDAAQGAATPAEHSSATRTTGDASASRADKSNASGEAASLRVSIEKIDQIINLVGELVITQSMLEQSSAEFDPVTHGSLLSGMAQLQRNARDLQESVMSIRMVPMDVVFNRFPRLVRDLAGKLGKKVELVTEGKATELDKGLIERIVDPMTHLVRNSLDHGIETPEKRRAAGKSETGTLKLSASHQGGNILIEISDDGGGLSRDRILKKAYSSGLAVSDAMSDDEVWQLIFAPGFSTSEEVTDLSGRGVGMDVVKRNISQMGGHVDIQSAQGQGTTIRIVLPLTLAILDGMSVRVGEEVYILPLGAIQESMQVTDDNLSSVTGSERVLYFRGDYLPLVELWRVFDIPNAKQEVKQGIVMVVQSEGRQFALLVDQLIGQHQVVVKSLETNYKRVPGISAATIMGDGSVALILDVPALSRATVKREAPQDSRRHEAAGLH
ncbi:chemotaxis protein CheW [Kushneria aurantia]|uniref:Chemotaxis protein CheA n=1 Tax=Kushneria aurantia TaxID=504092 RepID=A0ABV6G220_9GAMM|nr:chemotaxis protein CheW [Kushneria aurantia]